MTTRSTPPMPGETQVPTRSVPVDKVGDRASSTRASATRAGLTRNTTAKAKKEAIKDSLRKKMYTNVLQLPDSIEKRLMEKGYAYRWVRYKVSEFGRDDRANVAKWKELGYTFCTPEDVPELVFGYTPVNHEIMGNIITVGDLALAKVPIEVREAIIEVKEEETLKRSKGLLSERPRGVTVGNRSFVTRAQQRAEEITEEVEGDEVELLQGM